MDDADFNTLAAHTRAVTTGLLELCGLLVQRGAIAAEDTENVEAIMLRALRGDPHHDARAQLEIWFRRIRDTDPLPRD